MQLSVRDHAHLKTELEILFTPESRDQFLSDLKSRLFQAEYSQQEFVIRGNVTHDVWGGAWSVFFRIREGEVRAMLAHPDPGSWVATLLMPRALFEELEANLKNPARWESTDRRPSHHMNNLNLKLRVLVGES